MSTIKRLAGDTLWYGLSSIVGRVINILLIPIITATLSTAVFGDYSTLYSLVAVCFVFYTLRLETAYFRYGSSESDEHKAYSSALTLVYGMAAFLSLLFFFFSEQIIRLLNLASHYQIFIPMLAVILFFDAINEIPFSRLRLFNRPRRFAMIKILMILTNVAVVCFFFILCPRLIEHDVNWATRIYNPEYNLNYLIGANILSSAMAFVLLLPQWTAFWKGVDRRMTRNMVRYSLPLIIVGLAGIINETMDRIFLQNFLPYSSERVSEMVGIYSGNYKIAMFIALFTQAFRYAAEPFFFQQYKREDSNILYGKVATYYTIVSAFGFLAVALALPWLQDFFLRKPDYKAGYFVTILILLANILLGLYYNLSVWYKLQDRTHYGMFISLAGVAVTILGNVLFIPFLGYYASAWTTLACYLSMTILCYMIGRRFYTFRMEWKKIMVIFSLTIGSYFIYEFFWHNSVFDTGPARLIRILFFLIPLLIYYLMDQKEIWKVLRGQL